MSAVYTDGACSGNPGPGGWAWAIEGGRYQSGHDPQTTNQRMEIAAALDAVRTVDGPLEVVSDSTYVVHCFRDKWYEGWRKRGWLNSQKKPVANRDLWEPFIDLVLQRGDVTFSWVKGHSDDRMNDLVDRLAVQAITDRTGRSGTGWPDQLGPADEPRPERPSERETVPRKKASGGGPPLPEGHLTIVTGLRPTGLGGYDPNPVWDSVRGRIADALSYLKQEHPDLVVVSGMGLGSEQLGAEAAFDAGVPFALALAHRGVDAVWSAATRERFNALREKALVEVVFDDRKPTSKQQAGAMASRRDAWLAKNVDEAVVVHDGEDDRTEKTLAALTVQLGDDHIVQIHR